MMRGAWVRHEVPDAAMVHRGGCRRWGTVFLFFLTLMTHTALFAPLPGVLRALSVVLLILSVLFCSPAAPVALVPPTK